MFWQVLAGRISKKKGTANNAKNANEARINDLSRLGIGCALAVANTLGAGFLEKVYENALAYRASQAWSCRGSTRPCRRQIYHLPMEIRAFDE
jgi:hypothetical protein